MKNILFFIFSLFLLSLFACTPLHESIQKSTYSLDRIYEIQPGIDCNGRVVSLTVNPDNNKEFIAASETGGLYKSTDGGINWWHLDGLPLNSMMDVKYIPGDSSLIIATALADAKIENGGGIWISRDGGQFWEKSIMNFPYNSLSYFNTLPLEKYCAYGISFDTENIYVGTYFGIAKSNDRGHTWNLLLPRYSSSSSGPIYRIWSVLPLPGNRLIACSDNNVIYSNNGGLSWQSKIYTGVGNVWVIHAFTQSPFNPDYIFYTDYMGNIHYSLNGGIDWNSLEHPVLSYVNRPAFIKTSVDTTQNDDYFYLYHGNGINLYSKRCRIVNPENYNLENPWFMHSIDHLDPSELINDPVSGTPLILATDGGVHLTNDNGYSWRFASKIKNSLSGTFVNGLNALQIYDLNGQSIQSVPYPHFDLYFGTQDNYIWASTDSGKTWPFHDCCEGFIINLERNIDNEENSVVSYVACGDCYNIESKCHLRFPVVFNNCAADSFGAPFLCGNNKYIQYSNRNLYFTDNYSGDDLPLWTIIARIENELKGIPKISWRNDTIIVYQSIQKSDILPGCFIKRGLIRIDGVNTMNPVIRDADVNGFGSLGSYGTGFVCNLSSLGVNPQNPDHLIIADICDKKMKYSLDGGFNWFIDQNLTNAVIENGKFLFTNSNGSTQARVIEFNPFNVQKIFVGTEENGVIYSLDNGQNWQRFPNSERITNITSIFFVNEYEAYISTFGRGLWKIKFWHPGRINGTLPDQFAGTMDTPELYSFSNGNKKFLSRKSIDSLKTIDECSILSIKDGFINDLSYDNESNLLGLSISGGNIVIINPDKSNYKPHFYSSITNNYGNFNHNKLMQNLISEKKIIKGLILIKNRIVDVICHDKNINELFGKVNAAYYNSLKEPYFRIDYRSASSGLNYLYSGEKLSIQGKGFFNSNSFQVLINDKIVIEQLTTDNKGNIDSDLIINEIPGQYKIRIISLPQKQLQYECTISVLPKDPK